MGVSARSFAVYRVNDYDLQIQHNEAANLAVEHLGVTRTRTDKKYDGFFVHQPARAEVSIAPRREGRRRDSRSSVANDCRATQARRNALQCEDFRLARAMVDVVLIDTDYDGAVFNVVHSDVPERKNNLVQGRYELPAPRQGATVAVRIIDMLGE